MKLLFALVLIATNLNAATLSKYRSTPDGVASQKFILGDKEATLEKTSNFFDMKAKDYSVGIHKLTTINSEYKETVKKIEAFAVKLKKADEYLKTKDSSYNEVSGPVKHEVIILVDEFRIRPESTYYTELDRLFKKLQSMDWKLMKGYRITPDLEKIFEIDKGEVVKTSRYARDLYCKRTQLPTTCTLHGGGHIFVE
jgi:hypothetical protein